MKRFFIVVGLVSVAALIAGIAGIALWNYLNPPLPRIEEAKVLVILTTDFDHLEYSGVVSLLKKQGATVITASFTVGMVYGHGGSTVADITFSEVNISIFDAIFIPGGDSPYNIIHSSYNQTVLNLVRQADKEGKILAAICHGPWILAKAGVVNGKRVVGHSDTVADLKAAGGIVTAKLVERDGNLITAQYEGLRDFGNVLIIAISEKIGSR